jgi:hypothetical protein
VLLENLTKLPEIVLKARGLPAGWHNTGWSRAVTEAGLVQREYAWCEGLEPIVSHHGACVERIGFPVVVYEPEETDTDEFEYDQVADRMEAEFERAVKLASVALGPPVFYGRGESAGLPGGSVGDPVALWNVPTARVSVELQDNQGEEFLPWTLWVMVLPSVDTPDPKTARDVD